MRDEIIKFLCERQVTDVDYLTRGGYGGFYLNDDECPIFPYSHIASELKSTQKEIKPAMIELRNDGLVTLENAVDDEGMMNGCGWSLTEKGLKYAVENGLLSSKEEGKE